MERSGHNDLSLTSALERVLEASQRVILDRIDLLKLEAEEDVTKSLRGTSFIVGGIVFLLGGWFFFMVAVVSWLDAHLSTMASVAIVGAGHVIIGGALAGYGIRALRTIRLMKPDDAPAYSPGRVHSVRPG